MDSEEEAMAKLFAWAREHGAVLNFEPHRFEGYGFGGEAIEDIAVDSVIGFVPRELLLTAAAAEKAEEIVRLARPIVQEPSFGSKHFRNFDERERERWLLYIYLAVNRAKPEGPWAPYIRALPRVVRTPLHWSDAERAELAGSNLGVATEAQLIALRECVAEVEGALARAGAGGRLRLADFLWGYSVVWSRALSVLVDGRKVECLVPALDVLNHRRGTPISWLADGHRFAFKAGVAVAKGAQVFNNYGAKSNEELIANYGFEDGAEALGEEEVTVSVGVGAGGPAGRYAAPSDADLARARRLAAIATLRYPLRHRLRAAPPPDGLLDAIRVAVADEAELYNLYEHTGPLFIRPARGPFPPPVPSFPFPFSGRLGLGRANELRAHGTLLHLIQGLLDRFATSYEEDQAALPAATGARRIALVYRAGQKRVLRTCRCAVEAAAREAAKGPVPCGPWLEPAPAEAGEPPAKRARSEPEELPTEGRGMIRIPASHLVDAATARAHFGEPLAGDPEDDSVTALYLVRLAGRGALRRFGPEALRGSPLLWGDEERAAAEGTPLASDAAETARGARKEHARLAKAYGAKSRHRAAGLDFAREFSYPRFAWGLAALDALGFPFPMGTGPRFVIPLCLAIVPAEKELSYYDARDGSLHIVVPPAVAWLQPPFAGLGGMGPRELLERGGGGPERGAPPQGASFSLEAPEGGGVEAARRELLRAAMVPLEHHLPPDGGKGPPHQLLAAVRVCTMEAAALRAALDEVAAAPPNAPPKQLPAGVQRLFGALQEGEQAKEGETLRDTLRDLLASLPDPAAGAAAAPGVLAYARQHRASLEAALRVAGGEPDPPPATVPDSPQAPA